MIFRRKPGDNPTCEKALDYVSVIRKSSDWWLTDASMRAKPDGRQEGNNARNAGGLNGVPKRGVVRPQ
jgi:hypothetical protein